VAATFFFKKHCHRKKKLLALMARVVVVHDRERAAHVERDDIGCVELVERRCAYVRHTPTFGNASGDRRVHFFMRERVPFKRDRHCSLKSLRFRVSLLFYARLAPQKEKKLKKIEGAFFF
jgi:hypothetical protein